MQAWQKKNIDTDRSARSTGKSSKRQGRQSDPKKRKAVEQRAMQMATEHYAAQGYSVVDTSSSCPYDLECKRGNKTIRVEAKGYTGSLGAVDVTIGKVRSARMEICQTDLFGVHSIQLIEVDGVDFKAEGGKVLLIEDWNPSEDDLKPIRFRFEFAN